MTTSYTRHIAASWRAILLVGVLVAALAGAVSFALPLEYRAETQVFILSRTPAGVDPFTLAKTSERIGDNLTQIVYTSSFFEQTLATLKDVVVREDFGATERDQRKNWRRVVNVGVVPGTGFLRIAAFDEDPRRAGQIARGVVTTLVDKGWEYVGGEVQIKAVDSVVVSRFPVRPNVPLNMIFGFLAGVLGVAVFELIRAPRHAHNSHEGAVDWLRHL